jgi:hypothetical protein
MSDQRIDPTRHKRGGPPWSFVDSPQLVAWAGVTHCDTMGPMDNDRLKSFRLPNDLAERLEQFAEERDLTEGQVLRAALKAYLSSAGVSP